MERTKKVAYLSGVFASNNFNLRVIKGIRAHREDSTNLNLGEKIVRAHQDKSDCTIATHGEPSWRPAINLAKAYSGSECLAKLDGESRCGAML